MNTFVAILAFATVCTLPGCLAVPTSSGPVILPSSGGWDLSCLSPCANLAALQGLLTPASVLSVPQLQLQAPLLQGQYLNGQYLNGQLLQGQWLSSLNGVPCDSIPITLEKAITKPTLEYPCP